MPKAKRWWGWTVAGIAGVLLTSLFAAPVRAAPADDAKAHYQKATAHFAVGEYKDAAAEYEEAFKLKQDPALLYNAAQSFRLAGDNQKALLLYGNLVKLYPGSQYAAESKDRIAKIKAEMAAAPATTPPAAATPAATPPPAVPPPVAPIAPVTTPPPATPPPPAVTPVPPAPAPAAAPLVSTPPPAPEPESHPFYTRWWFWTAAGAVVAAGVITGIALSSGSTSPWANVSAIDRTAAKQ